MYEQTNADIIVLAARPEGGNAIRYFSPGLLNDPNAREPCESFPGYFEDAIAPRREVFQARKELLYSAQCQSVVPGSPGRAPGLSSSFPPEFPSELAEYLDYIGADSEKWAEIEAIWVDQRADLMAPSLQCLELTREQSNYIELLMLRNLNAPG